MESTHLGSLEERVVRLESEILSIDHRLRPVEDKQGEARTFLIERLATVERKAEELDRRWLGLAQEITSLRTTVRLAGVALGFLIPLGTALLVRLIAGVQ